MKTVVAFATLATSAFLLGGCADTNNKPVAGTPSKADQACLAAVSRETGNGDVTVLSSEFSQAGTGVTVGVGPQRAPWRCIAYSDGSTGGIQSLTNEGAL